MCRASVPVVALTILLFTLPAIGGPLSLATEAERDGRYDLVVRLLATGVASGFSGQCPSPPCTQAYELLADAYWMLGDDASLLRLVELPVFDGERRQAWICRVHERRGHARMAEVCWAGLGRSEEAGRAIRSRVLTELMAPPGSGVFGYRPPLP